jgi:hypothetical protein
MTENRVTTARALSTPFLQVTIDLKEKKPSYL